MAMARNSSPKSERELGGEIFASLSQMRDVLHNPQVGTPLGSGVKWISIDGRPPLSA